MLPPKRYLGICSASRERAVRRCGASRASPYGPAAPAGRTGCVQPSGGSEGGTVSLYRRGSSAITWAAGRGIPWPRPAEFRVRRNARVSQPGASSPTARPRIAIGAVAGAVPHELRWLYPNDAELVGWLDRVLRAGLHRPALRRASRTNARSATTTPGETTLKAAIFHGVGQPMTVENIEIDKPSRREVLVRTRVAGLCHSDLHFIEGKYPTPVPAVLGHEAAGVVEAVGEDVTHVKPGDHVVSCLSVFCGHCEYCSTGRPALCSNTAVKLPPGAAKRLRWKGEHLNQFLNLSAFAEQMLVHENAIVKVRPDMPLDLAALLGCGVLTGYGCVAHSARVEPGSSVAVIGCGGIGLSTLSAARLAGAARIIAIDKDPSKLDMARLFGATDGVDGGDPQRVAKVIEMTSGGVHHAIECVGLKQTTEDGWRVLSTGGTATIVGVLPVGVKVELNGVDFLRENRIQGSLMGYNHFRVDIPRLIDFHLQGRLQLDRMISSRMRLDQINEGFAVLQRGGIARSVIEFAS